MNERNSTHTMRALLLLREKILAGELAPGSRLLEVYLAEDLGISRTPVRDALSRLSEEGLLERGTRGGFIVRSFSLADALDAIELRGVLEGTAARLAAERGVQIETMSRMEYVVYRMDELFDSEGEIDDFEGYGELNARFHSILATLAGSEIVEREIERVSKLPFASPSAFIHEQSEAAAFRLSLVSAQAQHRSIVEAIAKREGFRAETVAREHARVARQNLEDAITNQRLTVRNVPSLALVVD
jgi:GntR family transcriptional regulator, vanillate catabolism transcriptional regulator